MGAKLLEQGVSVNLRIVVLVCSFLLVILTFLGLLALGVLKSANTVLDASPMQSIKMAVQRIK